MAVKYFSVFNACISGFVAGINTGKTQINGASGEPVEPSDFSAQYAAAVLFATEVDATLQSAESIPGNLAGMVSAGATVLMTTAALANAGQSLPTMMAALSTAAWFQKSLPVDANGNPFTAADYATIANTVAAQFLEACVNTVDT